MNEKSDAPARAVQLGAQLTVSHYESGEPHRLDIRYRIDNASTSPIGVLNTAAPTVGDPPRPAFSITNAGDLTVAYQLQAPRRFEAAVPQSLYATRLAPGEHYAQEVSVKLLSAYPNSESSPGLIRPERVRFCQAYAVHSAAGFTQVEDDGAVWLTQPGLYQAQELLCSKWIKLRAN